MSCEHSAILGDAYPGRFCIYCRAEVAKINADEHGQIYLERDGRRKYVAAIHKDRQRAAEGLTLDQGRPRITFKGDGDPTPVDMTTLLSAFQDHDEVLRIG
jgi:hypothetical protein